MIYVIKCVGIAGKVQQFDGAASGCYLASYDPEYKDGLGMARWTLRVDKAMTFASHANAFDLWRTQPKARPFRDDGKPNRPLTTFTIEIERIQT